MVPVYPLAEVTVTDEKLEVPDARVTFVAVIEYSDLTTVSERVPDAGL